MSGPLSFGGVGPPSSTAARQAFASLQAPSPACTRLLNFREGQTPPLLSRLLASTPSDPRTDLPAAAGPHLSACLGQRVPASGQVCFLLISGLLAAWSRKLSKFASFRTTCHSCKHLLSHFILKITVQAKSTYRPCFVGT